MAIVAGVKFDEPSGWYISGCGWSAGATASIPTPLPGVSAAIGGTAYTILVKNKNHESDSYACRIAAVVAGASAGWKSLISFGAVSIGPGSFQSAGLHPVLRQPFAPGAQGEAGAPTGFLGPCLSNNLTGNVAVGSGNVSVVLFGSTLGLASLLSASNALAARYGAFKYTGAYWSTGLTTPSAAVSIDATMHLGIVTHFDAYRARKGDNKMIKVGTTYWGPIANALGR